MDFPGSSLVQVLIQAQCYLASGIWQEKVKY
uniref:Uncharacterized protein n=1 Tax=Anguilla anguilla TaxID=7936 RepID=A0A0E9TIU2_ANGAN